MPKRLLTSRAAWQRSQRCVTRSRLFGEPDYLLRVVAADIAAYQQLRDEALATLPGVQRVTSTIVMKRIVGERPFPITVGRDS